MPLTRGERFDRGDFQARDSVLQARSESERTVAIAERLALAASSDAEPAPAEGLAAANLPASEDQSAARTHLAELGYTVAEIDKLIAGPKAG